MLIGVMLGLGTATMQSASYIFSRNYNHHHPKRNTLLLAQAHVLMLFASLGLLIGYWPETMPAFADYFPPLFLCAITYLGGQASLFLALRHADASRVSPLLGLKVFMLAIAYALFFSQTYACSQWAAIALSFIAAITLSLSGGRISGRSLIYTLAACALYSISDAYIKVTMDVLQTTIPDLMPRSYICVGLSYTMCGLASIPVVLLMKNRPEGSWKRAAPFAFFWFTAMLMMYACVSSIGVVFANIAQSTRGVISILLGLLVSFLGFTYLEVKVSKKVFAVRLAAGLLMVAAVILFSLGYEC